MQKIQGGRHLVQNKVSLQDITNLVLILQLPLSQGLSGPFDET